MSVKKKAVTAFASVTLDGIFKYIDKDPEKNLVKILDHAEKIIGDNIFPAENFKKLKAGAADPNNIYTILAKGMLKDIDRNILKHMLISLGIEGGYFGTKEVRANREKYGCNIPWQILFDPTSACNLKCKGCWAAEYGHRQSLTYDEMQSIISQGRELGTHFYMMTGGEPLIRKDDIIKLCENNPDCAFMAYTNGTLIDDALCEEAKRVSNLAFALSIEGSEESNDFRRGEGAYKDTMRAMELLKKHKCLFGISVCYTRQNLDYVISDEFVDKMIERGVKFAWYFNYMPVGHTADKELIPTPAQRKAMYFWLRKMRNSETGKPLMVIDFQDDGEYVGGCIAGGRNYFHVNSAGDMEPCVFIHYSDANIRTHTILEALQNPLFMAYHKGQPFNENHLRPCPMLENPDKLREIIHTTGAKSTNLITDEDVDTLCGRCDDFALEWQGVADEIWKSTKHPVTHTQYYRDGEKGVRQ
ncbi:MAG: radical SAM protein [Clostridia bacterium]|nr:radical SAM protein [Clostridia bacterium]